MPDAGSPPPGSPPTPGPPSPPTGLPPPGFPSQPPPNPPPPGYPPAGYGPPGQPPPGHLPPGYPPPGYPPPGQPPYGYAPPGFAPPGYAPPGYPPPGFPAFAWAAPVIGWGRFRPQSIGELLDSAFTVYRRRFLPVLAVMALFQLPYLALQYFVYDPAEAPVLNFVSQPAGSISAGQLQGAIGASLVALLILLGYGVVLLPLAEAAVIRLVSDDYLERASGVGAALGLALRRSGALVGYVVLQILIAAAPLLVVALLAWLVGGAGGVLLAIAGLLGWIVYLIFVVVRLSLGVPALVLEHLSPIAALRRGWRLTAGSFWRIVLFYLVINVVSGIVSSLLDGLVSLLIRTASVSTQLSLQTLASGLIGILTSPLILILLTLIYYDVRIRREAFDLEMLAQSL